MSSISLSSDTFNLFPLAPASHILRLERMPFTSFVTQEVNLPGVSATPARVAAPGLVVRHAPDRLTYDPLTVTFLVDEELKTHRELHSWLIGMTGGEDRSRLTASFVDNQASFQWGDARGNSQADKLARASTTTAGLTIINEAKIPILRVMFHNLYITSLGPIQFSVTVDPLTTLTSTATFEYDFYSIVEIKR